MLMKRLPDAVQFAIHDWSFKRGRPLLRRAERTARLRRALDASYSHALWTLVSLDLVPQDPRKPLAWRPRKMGCAVFASLGLHLIAVGTGPTN